MSYKRSPWIPLINRLPDVGQLVAVHNGRRPYIGKVTHKSEDGALIAWDFGLPEGQYVNPQYWMALPELPK